MTDIRKLREQTQVLLEECENRLATLEVDLPQAGKSTNESIVVNQTEKTPEAKNRNRAKNRAANQAALAQLCETYPDVFSRDNVRPLKVGIQEDLIADEKLARNRIKRALASYVRSPQYLRSLQVGADRIGLDGAASGQVSEEEAAHAQEKLKAIKDQRREREKTERKEGRAEQRKQAVKAKEQRINKKLDLLLQLNNRAR